MIIELKKEYNYHIIGTEICYCKASFENYTDLYYTVRDFLDCHKSTRRNYFVDKNNFFSDIEKVALWELERIYSVDKFDELKIENKEIHEYFKKTFGGINAVFEEFNKLQRTEIFYSFG